MHRKSKSDFKKDSLLPGMRYSYKMIHATLRLQPRTMEGLKIWEGEQ